MKNSLRTPMVTRRSRRLISLLFPQQCTSCARPFDSAERVLLCAACRETALAPPDQLCGMCGRLRRQLISDGRCVGCRNERNVFSQVVCLGPYGGLLRQFIVRMKHVGQQSLTCGLALELADRIAEMPDLYDLDVLVPVPSYWSRRILRGVGTSRVLAEALGATCGLPCSSRLMRCVRKTQKQSTLSPTARKKNVRGVFRVTHPELLQGLHVGLVDDTLTTGATANEAAGALLQAGATSVALFVLARADSRELQDGSGGYG